MLEVTSKALLGFLKKLVAIFLPALAVLPKFLKTLPNPSACIALSETVIDFFLIHIELYPINTLILLEVISRTIFVGRSVSSNNTITICFKFLEVHSLVHSLINCEVKVNVSPLKLTCL